MPGRIYQFEDFLLDVSERRLQKNGTPLPLPPKVFEVLAVLVERHGQLVGYNELMKEVWQDTFVEETNLRYCIHSLRKVFPEGLIETVPKRGYRFKPAVNSFSREDFIKKYAGREEPGDPVETGRPTPFFLLSRPTGMIGAAVLLILAGGVAFYFWPKKTLSQKPPHLSTIAVLPFEIIGAPAAEENEIRKGFADSLNFNLGKIRGLNVIPAREAAAAGSGREPDPLKIGRNLNADEVLTGTYRIENNLVRVNVALWRVADNEPAWTKTFTVEGSSKIEAETAISLPIAYQISADTARRRDAARIKNSPVGEEIKQSYLTAREILRLGDFNRRREAAVLFEKILAAEPGWALANAGFAEALVLTHGGETSCRNAPQTARRALEIDDTIAEAYLVLGLCHQYNYDWKSAEQAYREAIRINPEYAKAYHDYAAMLDLQRRFSEAENNFKKAVEIEPFSPDFRASFCQHFYYDKNYGEALAQCFEGRKIDPDFWQIPKKLHWIYMAQGRFDEAFRLHYANLSETDLAKNPSARALGDGDMKKFWETSIETRLNDPRKRSSPFAIAGFYTQLGEKEKALDFLEREFEIETCKCNLPIANADPVFDSLRKELRFIELMKKINLAR